MKFEIQLYKSQLIEYDDEIDKFVCDITIEDRNKSTKRQTLKDVRSEIDAFVKLNLEFKPFMVLKMESYNTEFEIIYVEGIRTDGKFTCTNERRKENNRPGYDLVDFETEIRSGRKYFVYDPEIIREKKEIEAEEKKYEQIIRDKEKILVKKLKKLDLKPYEKYKNAFKK